MATAVDRSWSEPDHGIWEIRSEKRHHVHSKVMCWLAIDRAVQLAADVGLQRDSWGTLRDRIAADILAHGFNAERNAFTAAYNLPEPDAATLTIALSGLLPASDPRFISTVEFVEKHLLRAGTVYRYRYDDGLPGLEGVFHLCTGWLIESLVAIGRREQAMSLFEGLVRCAGHTGLLTEQWCPSEQTGLGNLPQMYSHAALINAAVALEPG